MDNNRDSIRRFDRPRRSGGQNRKVVGRKPVVELLLSGSPVERIYMQKAAHGDSIAEIKALAAEAKVPILSVPKEKMARLSSTNHQGIIAFSSPIKFHQLDDILPWIYEQGEQPLFLLLDGVTDMGNFGAIARSAYCAGVHALILPSRGTAPINDLAIKASAGALSHLRVCRELKLSDALNFFRTNGIPLAGLDSDGDKLPWESDLGGPLALVLGDEGEGLSEDVRNQLQMEIRLPMANDFDSYNVSVATGMILYECCRQRSKSS